MANSRKKKPNNVIAQFSFYFEHSFRFITICFFPSRHTRIVLLSLINMRRAA